MSDREVIRPTGEGFSSGEGFLARAVYRTFQAVLWLVFKIYFRQTISGAENIPKDGPFILAPVHRSYLDTPLQAPVPRRLRFMGKDSMWKYPASAWLLSTLGGCVSRSSRETSGRSRSTSAKGLAFCARRATATAWGRGSTRW